MTNTQIQSEARDIFLNQEPSDAIKLIRAIKAEPKIDESMQLLMTQLQFIRMFSLNTDQLLKLLEEDMLIAYTIPDFSLAEKVEEYIDQVESMIEQIKVAKKIKLTIQDNEAVFSEPNIMVKGQQLPGTIKNWIVDYNNFPMKGDAVGGALDEVEFTNKSDNSKKLSDVQRGVLRDILNMYDNLTTIIANWDAIPIAKNEEEAFKDFDLYRYIPGLEDDLEEEDKAKASNQRIIDGIGTKSNLRIESQQESISFVPQVPVVQAPPVTQLSSEQVPQESNQPTPEQRRAVEDIKRAQHTPVNYNNAGASASNSMSASDSAKIRELINHTPPQSKRGVTMDPTNVKIDEEEQRLNAARAKQAADIQRKLAELRTRNGSNSKDSSDTAPESQNKTE